jgi:hypothetical protein
MPGLITSNTVDRFAGFDDFAWCCADMLSDGLNRVSRFSDMRRPTEHDRSNVTDNASARGTAVLGLLHSVGPPTTGATARFQQSAQEERTLDSDAPVLLSDCKKNYCYDAYHR